MAAFVTNGPDIPERLLWAHEDGRVVFFCGAGISYPAGLPGFDGLVKEVYSRLGLKPTDIQQAAINASQFDSAINLLEAHVVGGREVVRHAIEEILTPTVTKPGSTATHEALLTLARSRDSRMRLITTNFDRLFETVITNKNIGVERFSAPFLPVPKNRWNGLVYLHGLLPSKPTVHELDRLVVSSGDFGLAYLTERWAARFVSELFRNYTVCFIGYSINDPVLRYMMDALAADHLLGEVSPEIFAFGSYSKKSEKQTDDQWRAKNVTPILYREHKRHAYLHRTLHEWARTYRDRVQGKKMIIAQHASTPPLTSSRSDFVVGRVLWALTDSLAAERFADLRPVPPLGWLEPLSEKQFRHEDLPLFGVVTNSAKVANNNDQSLNFSILCRPAPSTHAPWMCLVDPIIFRGGLDEVMVHLARWLTRHLDDPKLILWIAENGGQLHDHFARLLHTQIEYVGRLIAENQHEELDRIRAGAPKAIPGPSMRTLWHLVLAGRLQSNADRFAFHDWLDKVKQDGVTPSLRMKLREILTPCVKLHPPFRWGEDVHERSDSPRIRDLVEWELVLSCDHVHDTLSNRGNKPKWHAALPDLLQDFTLLLRDALDLKRELGGADEKNDLSYIHFPSISEDPSNRYLYDWTALIRLTRDAWLETAKSDHKRARRVAESWWEIPYPVFKRLSLFAATHHEVISQRQALNWLLADKHWWFWSGETMRESLRLLVALADKLDASAMRKLEGAILNGPPREMYRDDLEMETWALIVDRDIGVRLKKVQIAGGVLNREAENKLDEMALRYPKWRLSENEKEEFSSWVESGGERYDKFLHAPRRRRELVEWLRKQGKPDFLTGDDWPQRCRDNFPTTACALYALAKEGIWLDTRWRDALHAWSESKLARKSWRRMGPVLSDAPDEFVQSCDHSISWWLEAIASTFEGNEELFIALCRRILVQVPQDGNESEDRISEYLVSKAINHPVGHVARALLHWWYRQSPTDGQCLPETLKLIFTELCDTSMDKFRPGRLILAVHVIALYRVDYDWVKDHVIPLFAWQRSETEARYAWCGFLWSPRLYRPLLSDIKKPMLETARNYEKLDDDAKQQYADFLTFVSLDPSDTFTIQELRDTTYALPLKGLEGVAQALVRALKGAQDQRDEYWRNRLRPYLRKIWPKDENLRTPAISESFARLCVVAGEVFPEVLKELWHWLRPLKYPDWIVSCLCDEQICKQFPADALKFLGVVVDDNAYLIPQKLKQCLDAIKQADSPLGDDAFFIKLDKLVQKYGGKSVAES